MRRILVFAAVTSMSLAIVAEPPRARAAETALPTARWALEVGTDLGNSDLGATIGIRKHLNEHSALRLETSFIWNHQRGDGTTVRTSATNPTQTSPTSMFFESQSQTLALHWMHFTPVREGLTAVFATGPVVTRQRLVSRDVFFIGQPTYLSIESTQRTLTGGWEAILGFEWFFSHRLSLGGDVGARAEFGTMKLDNLSKEGAGPTYETNDQTSDLKVRSVHSSNGRIRIVAYL
jgi:hypothetical protein